MQFKFRAKESSGKEIDSFIEANSREAAIEKICQFGYYPLSVDAVSKTVHGKG